MGITSSKSHLERRNTVARRSQRRSVHNVKSKVERVLQDVKKFKSIEEDVNFNALMSEIDHLRIELMRKSKDLQPQVRNIYDVTLGKVDECEQALRKKLEENQEKYRKKEEAEQEKAKKKEEKKKEKDPETIEDNNDIVTIQEENEALDLAENLEKRKTLEVKFVQIIPPREEDEETDQGRNSRVVSPEEKRKSILKVGVPVMPNAMLNEISAKSKKISTRYSHQDLLETVEKSDEDLVTRVNDIVNHLQTIEIQISDFVGKKNGTQYNRIRDQLNDYLIELNQMNSIDEYVADQVKLCKNFIGSNLSFLEEKAVMAEYDNRYDSNDDVFLSDNNNVPLSPVEAEKKFHKLTKTTAI